MTITWTSAILMALFIAAICAMDNYGRKPKNKPKGGKSQSQGQRQPSKYRIAKAQDGMFEVIDREAGQVVFYAPTKEECDEWRRANM